ncbi:arsenic resistance protein [Microbacterium album]|uniref:Arsenic resistance protein n=1 Tax=Microbacterium album TaxID=2053191 RepID=A0A917ICL3_9MICO|nr:arsenic resistance protein [Microbacterium album]GGH35918.1 arsenic resistance protein [Microbacterium album]
MDRIAQALERHQVALYLVALAVGAAVGLAAPLVAAPLERAITPLLALLLYATFLGVPLARVSAALRDRRFLATLAVVNFVVAPVVAFGVSRLVAADEALLVGVLFVLLTPCIDYVIAFSGLAGGSRDRLLAATPLLMLGQMVLLPLYLWAMAGPALVSAIVPGPFLEAFLVLIVLPLAAAAVTQALATRHPAARHAGRAATTAMVPLMMLTLGAVVASQVAAVGGDLARLAPVIPVFVLFAAVMTAVGVVAARVAGLGMPDGRAVLFSGVTRNSLVVLPLVLALPERLSPAPLVVVTQTLIELVVMVVLVRVAPRLLPTRTDVGGGA